MEPFNILIVCTGNICRSPMAEGMISHLMPGKLKRIVRVSSAGTHALHGNQPSDLAVQVMKSYGIDIGGHRARKISRSMIKSADLILVMERLHLKHIRLMHFFSRNKVHLLSEFDQGGEPYDIPDPLGGDEELYAASAKSIFNCVQGVNAYLEENIDR